MGRIALIGATGAVGTAIVDVLRSQGRAYRAIGRTRTTLETRFGGDPIADIRTWNCDAASAAAALEGIDTAIYLVGVEYWKFALHPRYMAAALAGAQAAGVRRFILVGTVYPFGRAQTAPVDENHPREPHTFKGRMRKEQEDLVLRAHRTGEFETTIVRLPDLYGPNMEKSLLTGQFVAAPTGKRSPLLAPADRAHQYAYIPDCAEIIVELLDEPRAYGRTWNYAGPGAIAPREFADAIYGAAGHRPNYYLVGKPLLRVLGLFSPLMRELVEMNYLMSEPVLLDDSALRALLGELPRTSYADGIAKTLAAQRSRAAV